MYIGSLCNLASWRGAKALSLIILLFWFAIGFAKVQLRPDFEMSDLDGNVRTIAEWDGKVIVLNFWATWCAPCLEEMPHFAALDKKYRDSGLQFVGVAIDYDFEAVKKFLDKVGVAYPNLIGEDAGAEASALYGNSLGGLPYTAVINRQGEIVLQHSGVLHFDEAEAIINAHL